MNYPTPAISIVRSSRIKDLSFFAMVIAAALAGDGVDSRAVAEGSEKVRIDFARDVRPILSDNCFLCHGPAEDSREADLRLDDRESATMDRGDYAAIVPGDVASSELIQRITSAESHEAMPPPDSGKSLTPAQIDVLRRWIDQGAEWSMHWAFIAPERPEVPPTASDHVPL